MSRTRVVIVGAGVIGLTHALTALEHGHAVTVLERDGRALGASVRNFGTLWPIGCVPGPERERALFGVRRWRELADRIGLWTQPEGSLALAHRDEAWAMLQESAAAGDQVAVAAYDGRGHLAGRRLTWSSSVGCGNCVAAVRSPHRTATAARPASRRHHRRDAAPLAAHFDHPELTNRA